MKIHEYQAAALLEEYGVPVPERVLAATPEEAAAAARGFGRPVVLKAQVHAGGRGKAGGVRLARTAAEAGEIAASMLGLSIKGLPVRKLLVVPAAAIRAEVYLSLLVDRAASQLVFVGCAQGGVEIEETARLTPEKILRLEVPAVRSGPPAPEEYGIFAAKLLPEPALAAATARVMAAMERLFRARDCALIEINPLAVERDGRLLALDAKVLLDDNALYRQPANTKLQDGEAADAAEAEARAAGLSFIGLEGNIGCMVNGAGLAMATMDAIQLLGGAPANFLDVGGSSSVQKITTGFEIILRNPRVTVILVNIFGGITRCDEVARGLLLATEKQRLRVPIVIRLVGTNAQEGRALLSGKDLIVAETLEDGARQAVQIGAQP